MLKNYQDIRIIKCAVLGCLLLTNCNTKKAEKEIVKSEIEYINKEELVSDLTSIAKASLSGDYETIHKYTYPTFIDPSISEEELKKRYKDMAALLKFSDIEFENLKVGKPLGHFETEKHQYFWVTSEITIRQKLKQETNKTTQMGVINKADDQRYYLEVSRISREQFLKMFEDVPTKQILPFPTQAELNAKLEKLRAKSAKKKAAKLEQLKEVQRKLKEVNK